MIKAGQYPEDVDGALNYLVGNKDSFGTWQTTQATILTLRAMLASMEQSAAPGAAAEIHTVSPAGAAGLRLRERW